MTSNLKYGFIAAALIALPAAPALAQDDVKERAAEIADQANEVQQDARDLANDVVEARDERRNEAAGADGDGTGASDRDRDDGDGFDWGLLGLLGLAGLLGLKRRDDHVRAADVRHDTRP